MASFDKHAVNDARIAELCQKETQLLHELQQVRDDIASLRCTSFDLGPGVQLNIEKTCNTAADVVNKPFHFFHTPIVFDKKSGSRSNPIVRDDTGTLV